MAELIDTSVFTSQLFLEGSWGARDVGEYESTMELYFNPDNTGFIEWSIPDADLLNPLDFGLSLTRWVVEL